MIRQLFQPTPKTGNIVKWRYISRSRNWYVQLTGVVISSSLVKTDYEKIRVLKVLDNTGQAVEVREDEASLELIRAA